MSFFMKTARRTDRKFEEVPKTTKYSRKRPRSEDEISSSEDERAVAAADVATSSDDEQQTVQEKKLRLARKYLKQIEEEEIKRPQDECDNPESNLHGVSKRLRNDYLEDIGRLKVSLGRPSTVADLDNLVTLKAKEHKKSITQSCVSPDGKYLFSGSKDGSIVKWDIATSKKLGTIPFCRRKKESEPTSTKKGHSGSISGLAVSGDNKYLASSDYGDSLVHVWDTASLAHRHTFRGHQRPVTSLACHGPDLYTASADRTVRVWRLGSPDFTYVETLYGHQEGVADVDVPMSGRTGAAAAHVLSAGGRDGTARVWKLADESQLVFDAAAGSQRHSAGGSVDVVRFLSENVFISGADTGDICVWCTGRKKPLCAVRVAHGMDQANSPYWITSLAVLYNTSVFASGSHNGSIKLWQVSDSIRTITMLSEIAMDGFINSMHLTTGGKTLIAAIGREHKIGRWTVSNSAQNSIKLIQLRADDTQ